MSKVLEQLIVRQRPGTVPAEGSLSAAEVHYPCLLGRAGITTRKREGDWATPAGHFPLLFGFWRADRLAIPATALPMRRITPRLGWCDAPAAAGYNRLLTLPSRHAHEKMHRDDTLYDICLVLDYNYSRRARYRGSAIFLHLTADKPHTAGCVALARAHMLQLLPRLTAGTLISILP